MKPRSFALAGFCVSLVLVRVSFASIGGHVDGPASATAAWAGRIEEKLARFEAARGLRIRMEHHAKSPAPEEDAVPGAYMRALAGQRGVADKGVLAVYFADEGEWRLWVGDHLTSAFVGKPGTAQELTKSGAIHREKEAFLASVQSTASATLAADRTAAGAAQPPSPEHRWEVQADAMAEALTRKFGAAEATSSKLRSEVERLLRFG